MSQYARYSNLAGSGGGGGGVTSLNSETGALNLVAGSGITITPGSPTATDITIASTGAGSGTVTSVSVVSANGLAGTVANPTTTPAITLSSTITGVLKGNGTAISAAVVGTDYVIPSGSITGTASNITASSNSTLTTLSALALPGGQVTGNIAGNAANVTGVVAVVNGGTSLSTLTLNNVILGNGTSAPTFVAPGPSGNILSSNGTTWNSTTPVGNSAFISYASSQVNTISTAITSGSFTTFDNSPAFTFTPTITGTYKIHVSAPVQSPAASFPGSQIRIFNTSGGASLLEESQAGIFNQNTSAEAISLYTSSNYTLTAGITYVFDIQGKSTGGTSTFLRGDVAPFYMFAEGIGLATTSPTGSYAQAFFASASGWSTASSSYADGTNAGGNALTVRRSSGITLTAAGSNLCGITFTPPVNTAVYLVTATFPFQNSLSDATSVVKLTDGTQDVSTGMYNNTNTGTDVICPTTISGIYAPAVNTAVTVKLMIASIAGSGTTKINNPGITSLANAVEWTVVRIA